MPEHDWGDELFRAVDELAEVASDEHASSRLKARIYSAMTREQPGTRRLHNLT